MADKADNSRTHLEQVLRRWGAQEAARSVTIGGAPPAGTAALRLRRWMPLAAAVAVLAVAVWLLVRSLAFSPNAAPDGRSAGDPAKLELAKLRLDHQAVMEELRKTQEQLRAQQTQAATQQAITSERQQFQARLAERDELLRQAQASLGQLQAAIAGKEGEIGRLKETLQAAGDKAKRFEAAARSAAEENIHLRKSFEQAVAAERKAAAELTAMRAQRAAMLDYFQQAYLSPAPDQPAGPARVTLEKSTDGQGLRARQEVLNRSRLIERCARIRATVQDQAARDLLDRLEAVLTRLDLLDAKDPSAAEILSSLVRAGDLLGQIDKVLADEQEDPALRVWLFEAMLVLRRPNRAG